MLCFVRFNVRYLYSNSFESETTAKKQCFFPFRIVVAAADRFCVPYYYFLVVFTFL